jgi:hypothetical protein
MNHISRISVKTVCITLLAMGLASARAQSNGFDGEWAASWVGTQGGNLSATLTLKEQSGRWRMLMDGRNSHRTNNCIGKEFNVAVVSKSETDMVLEVDPTKTIPGCNLKLSLKQQTSKTLEGKLLATGIDVKFNRSN